MRWSLTNAGTQIFKEKARNVRSFGLAHNSRKRVSIETEFRIKP